MFFILFRFYFFLRDTKAILTSLINNKSNNYNLENYPSLTIPPDNFPREVNDVLCYMKMNIYCVQQIFIWIGNEATDWEKQESMKTSHVSFSSITQMFQV